MIDLSGQYLGRYYLNEQLGEGGMAVVYKAYDTRLEREVAIKIIRSGAFPPDALSEILKRFEREAKSLAKLSHPNIVKVYDYGEHEGSPYLVMEYLPGGTLKRLLGKPLPWQEAVRLILPVARGVAYAHQRGVLHRDIKPANVLITDSGEPMLSDFGIAKLFEGNQTTALTGSGMAVGTPEYMAPEQWTGTASPQSDLYSLGIVLYEMVAGRKPYVADTPAAILIKQATETLPNPRNFASDLPEALEFALIKVLAKEPENRYMDVNAFTKALEDLFVPTSLTQASLPPKVEELSQETLPEGVPLVSTQVALRDDGSTMMPVESSGIQQVTEVYPAKQPKQAPLLSRFSLKWTAIVVGGLVFATAVWSFLPNMTTAFPATPTFTPTVAPTRTRTPLLTSTLTLKPTSTSLPVTFTPALTPTSVFLECDRNSANVQYVADVTIPDGTEMNPGQVFLKTWKIRNSGSCSWGAGYKLTFTFGNKMSGQPQGLLGDVAPGQEIEVSVQFTAPTQKGEYRSSWRMVNAAGVYFGDEFFVNIIVK